MLYKPPVTACPLKVCGRESSELRATGGAMEAARCLPATSATVLRLLELLTLGRLRSVLVELSGRLLSLAIVAEVATGLLFRARSLPGVFAAGFDFKAIFPSPAADRLEAAVAFLATGALALGAGRRGLFPAVTFWWDPEAELVLLVLFAAERGWFAFIDAGLVLCRTGCRAVLAPAFLATVRSADFAPDRRWATEGDAEFEVLFFLLAGDAFAVELLAVA
jgi:hypothetical protein